MAPVLSFCWLWQLYSFPCVPLSPPHNTFGTTSTDRVDGSLPLRSRTRIRRVCLTICPPHRRASVQTTEFMSLGEIRQTLAPVLTTTTFLDWAARRRTRSPTTTSSQIRFIPTTPALLTTPETKATPRAQAPPYRCVCAAARFRCSVREAEAIPA